MNFSQKVKREISERETAAPCCVAAACYGVACFGRYFDTKGVVLHTERAYIAQWAKSVYMQAGVRGKVYARGNDVRRSYEFAVKDPYEVEKLLAMFGHTGDETAVRIHSDNLVCEGCVQQFVAAAFMCCGTIVDPQKGYNLEFVAGRHLLMQDLAQLLQKEGFAPKLTQRKGAGVLYFKASGQIEDILTFMGAQHSALELMGQKVLRDIRNKTNRITNCETANIDKTVKANLQTLAAIDTLRKHGVLQMLTPQMLQTVEFLEQNPELSLMELAQLFPEPVSKSGLSHRLKKINEMARNINERQQHGE